jgi:hypothetical protein
VVIKAANEFKDKTTGVDQLWQTDFTHFKVLGWGWFYLSTILDDCTSSNGWRRTAHKTLNFIRAIR